VTRYPGGTFSLRTSAAVGARWFVRITNGVREANGQLDALLGRSYPFSAQRCPVRGGRVVCVAGPFEAIPPPLNPWTVWVVKESASPATVTVRLAFST
jgi:hypothetical protein